MKAVAIFLFAFLLLTSPCSARTWHIDPDGAGDAPTIQAGIDSAAVGDTVLLHSGVFVGSENKNLEFRGKDLVLRSIAGPANTIIDCEYSGRGLHIHEGETFAATIEGVTIQHGGTSGSGGGALLENPVTLRNCRIVENQANTGGGLYNSGRIRMFDCLISENTAQYNGGGVHSWTHSAELIGCTISSNTALTGGGISIQGDGSFIWLDSCVVTGNLAYGQGGGIHVDYDGFQNEQITQSTITGNSALGGAGGGVYFDCAGCMLNLERSIIWDNCADYGDEILMNRGYMVGLQSDVDSAGVEGNGGAYYLESMFLAPLFCQPASCEEAPTPSGSFELDPWSPCLPENNPIGPWLIGARNEGCTATSVLTGRSEATSWGAVKTLFR